MMAEMKDHIVRGVVNALRETAIEHHASGQLRERLRGDLDPLLAACGTAYLPAQAGSSPGDTPIEHEAQPATPIPTNAILNFNSLVMAIRSDHHAITCQSIGQYRTMLLGFAAQLLQHPMAEVS